MISFKKIFLFSISIPVNIVLTILLLQLISEIKAMEEPPIAQHTEIIQSTARMKSLKQLCLKKLIVGNIRLEAADRLLCPDLKGTVREELLRALYTNLLLFLGSFKPLYCREFEYPKDDKSVAFPSVRFSPNGRYILMDSADNKTYLWDLHHESNNACIELSGSVGTFSPNGKYLLTGTHNYLNWYEPQEIPMRFDQLGKPLFTNMSQFKAIAFCHSSKFVLTADSNAIILWQGPFIRAILQGTNSCIGLAFAIDGKTALACSRDGTVFSWNVEQSLRALAFDPFQPMNLEQNPLPPELLRQVRCDNSVTFSPCACFLLNCSDDKTAQLWDLYHPDEGETILKGHTGYVNAGAFSTDGRYVLTCSYDQTVRIWDISKKPIVTSMILITNTDIVMSVAFSPNGRQFLIGTMWGIIKLFDIDASVQELTLTQLQHLLALDKDVVARGIDNVYADPPSLCTLI